MAKGRHYTPYQQGVIRRYYENRDTLASQRLGEIVTELYLCQGEAKKSERLWKQAEQALRKTQTPAASIDRILAARDVEKLATLAGEISFRDAPQEGAGGKPGSRRGGASRGRR